MIDTLLGGLIGGVCLIIFLALFVSDSEMIISKIAQWVLLLVGVTLLIIAGICRAEANIKTINEARIQTNTSISISTDEKVNCQPIGLENAAIHSVTPLQDNTDVALIDYSYAGNNNVEITEKAVMVYDAQMIQGWYEGFADYKYSCLFVLSQCTIPTKIYVTNCKDDLKTIK